MEPDRQAALIANDLDSLIHRVESLPAHAKYTSALEHVCQAKLDVQEGMADLHQAAMRERHGPGRLVPPHGSGPDNQ